MFLTDVSNSLKRNLGGLKYVKIVSFITSLITCCLLGSILIFPLISQELMNQLQFKTFQINVIVSLISAGMYLCLPGLGYLGDNYGNNLLSIIGMICLGIPYYANSIICNDTNTTPQQQKLIMMGINYMLIGLGTSGLYFSSLLNCSKIYPNHKGLSISLPVSCYGLSSLISTQILKLPWFHDPITHILDLHKLFTFFSGLYFIMGIISFICQSAIGNEVLKTPEQTELIPISSIEPPNHKQNFIRFLKDPIMYILLLSLFLNIGPLETYQSNLNTILNFNASKYDNDLLNDQIMVLSIFSIITRLVVGLLSDYYNTRMLLMGLLIIGIIDQILAVNISDINITIITMLDGIAYGGLFTIYPTILAELWGVDILGSTWGTFMISPALSSMLFALIYGRSIDVLGQVYYYFIMTSISLMISFGLVASVIRAKLYRKTRQEAREE